MSETTTVVRICFLNIRKCVVLIIFLCLYVQMKQSSEWVLKISLENVGRGLLCYTLLG
jgi:hypothetical protein